MTTRPPDADNAPLSDPAFDAAWRAASRELPPPALDDAILAASRRAVDAGPQRVREATRPLRWWWPLAAAATIGSIAIGILQLGAPDRNGAPATEPATVSDMPAAMVPKREPGVAADRALAPGATVSKSRSVATGSAVAPAPQAVAPPAHDGARRTESRTAADALPPAAAPAAGEAATPDRRAAGGANAFPATAPAASAPVAPASVASEPVALPPTAAKPAAETSVAAGTVAAPAAGIAQPFSAGVLSRSDLRDEGLRALAASGALAARSAVSADSAARAQQRPPLPVADWIALIRKLRADGRIDDAAKELAAFRREHPDHSGLLPDDLRDWLPPDR